MTAIPVTILTGFLGAGKTTLLNRILAAADGRRYAVIVNEFGEVGIDGELIVGAADDLLELANGCVCCTMRGDLLRTVHQLLAGPRRFDAIVVETSGVSDPGPVAQTFLADAWLREATTIDAVICLVDAVHGARTLAEHATARAQAAFADRLLATKADLADAAALEPRLRALNPAAPILRLSRATPLPPMFGIGAFDLARLEVAAGYSAPEHVHGPDCGHGHLGDIASVSLASDVPLDAARLTEWLDAVVTGAAADLLRAKGVVAIAGEDRRLVFHAVHAHLEGEYQRDWGAGEPRHSRLVFIGRGLDQVALAAGLARCASEADALT